MDHSPTYAELSRRVGRMAAAAPAVMAGFRKLHGATQTVGVAVMMGGGPAVLYGSQALEALDGASAGVVAGEADLPGDDRVTAPSDS
jgi:hypothetical protein